MKPEEFEVYVIPPNFMEGGTLFGGLLKTRNTIEAVILGLAVGVPVLRLPFSITVRVVILCLTALPLVLLALIGVSGMSLSAFIRLFFCFLRNRRVASAERWRCVLSLRRRTARKIRRRHGTSTRSAIASVTLPVIGELPEARFISTQITDDFMYIKVVNPRLQADVVPGDVVQAGVIISNSETGLGSVTIQPLIYRLVCSNGMVINDAKTRRNHVGRAATSEEDFSIYSNETLLADDHAFVLKIKDTVRAAISEARFAQAVSRMRASTEAMLDTKQLPAIVKLASSSFGITEDESNGVLEHLITGGDFSLYGLANAVTRFSQDVESYDRATKLEEIGYSVMTMPPALFRQMNRTELLAA